MNDPLDMRDEIVEAAASHGASNVRVFGSAVRNKRRQGSDLDLLVRMEEGRSLFDLIALSQELEEGLASRSTSSAREVSYLEFR